MTYNNDSLILNIRALRRILKQGDEITKEIDDTMAEINADTDHSESWKAGKLDKARQVRNSELRRLGAAAMPLIEEVDRQITARRDNFDHRDPDFMSAIQTLQFYGKGLPYDVGKSIVDSLRGNYKALRAVEAAFKTYDLSTAYLNEVMGPMGSLGVSEAGAVSEFISYAASDLATANEWRAGNIRAMLDRYERALGVDSSVNPILAKLDAFISDPNAAPAMRERAKTWRNAYAEPLEADEGRAMELTENRLEAWSHGQAVPPQGADQRG